MSDRTTPMSYGEITRVFLKIGAQAFGGWPTSILLVEKELVEKQYLTKRQTRAAITYAYLTPGALQVSFISHIGYLLRGFNGATLAVVAYLFPALSLMVVFSEVYFRFIHNTQFTSYMGGLGAALGGVILASAYKIGKGHAGRSWLWLLVLMAFVLRIWLGVNIVVIILGFGVSGALFSFWQARKRMA